MVVSGLHVAALGTINDAIHFSAVYNCEHRELLEAIEHDHLHRLVYPRLDHLVYILVYKDITAYMAHAEILEYRYYQLGRSKQ